MEMQAKLGNLHAAVITAQCLPAALVPGIHVLDQLNKKT
jgi:hypothetical protein